MTSADRPNRRRADRVTVEWAARFETGVTRVAGAVVDASEVGLRIADERPLPPGAAGRLTLTFRELDGRIEVVEMTATVVRSGLGGVALTYSRLPDHAARRLRARGITAESRRRASRVRVTLPIEVRSEIGAPIPGETVDLSAYSARVTTAAPLDPGARVELRVALGAGKPPMALPSVVWQIDASGEAVLMFANLAADDFSRLGDYLAW
jgi:hypothetical protein